MLVGVDAWVRAGVHPHAGSSGKATHKVAATSGRECAKISVSVSALYSIPLEEPPDDLAQKGFEAFARVNGTFNLWPFLREEVSRLCMQTLHIPFFLPLLEVHRKD